MTCRHVPQDPCEWVYAFDVGYCIVRPPTPGNTLYRKVVVAACTEADASTVAVYMLYALGLACTREEQLAKGHKLPKRRHQPIAHLPGQVEMVTSTRLLARYRQVC